MKTLSKRRPPMDARKHVRFDDFMCKVLDTYCVEERVNSVSAAIRRELPNAPRIRRLIARLSNTNGKTRK